MTFPKSVELEANTWSIGAMIGRGGFGRVFEASSGDQSAAIKFIPKGDASQREFELQLPEGVRNVVPVLDKGEDEDHWIIAMPKATRSLHDRMQETTAPIPLEESLVILADVALALWDLQDKLVHRDIKPQNILELNGRWCVADFGIARYAEASTASQTFKDRGSKEYLAPERWRFEHATHATDIYSLGVVAFELVNGRLPFEGDSAAQRHGHLSQTPPESKGPQTLQWLIADSLKKMPQLRPSAENFYDRLQKSMTTTYAPGFLTLIEADRDYSDRLDKAEMERQTAETAAELRQGRVEHARETLTRVSDALSSALTGLSDRAEYVEGANYAWTIKLASATLSFSAMYYFDNDRNDESDAGLPFSVAARASVGVTQGQSGATPYKARSHSLWYADVERPGEYEWYEVAFMQVDGLAPTDRPKPFDLAPESAEAVAALRETGNNVVHFPFTKLVADDCDDFLQRWANWLGQAYGGELEPGAHDPDARNTWRH